MNAYISILKARTQGDIKGPVVQKGREGWMEIFSCEHEVISPRDSASGLAVGKRVHKPLIVTKENDRSTPQLYQCLVTNEQITIVEIRFFTSKPTGIETNYFTITLTDATVSAMKFQKRPTFLPENQRLPELLEISFTYRRIEWNDKLDGITSGDNWMAPS